MKTLKTVTFTDQVEHMVPDLKIEEWYQSLLIDLIINKVEDIFISSFLQVTRLRVAITEMEITPFVLILNNEQYETNEYGKFKNFPNELDLNTNYLYQIL